MKNYYKYVSSFFISFLLSFVIVHFFAFPTFESYPRLMRIINRFSYSELILWLLFAIILWLFYIQYIHKSFSTIYIYLVVSIYLLLLFVVLFTKAPVYRNFSFNILEFFQPNIRILREAVLNIIYFIPLGMIYGLGVEKKEFWIISFTTIVGIETIQYVFYLGTFSLADLFLNLIGTAAGFYIVKYFLKNFSH